MKTITRFPALIMAAMALASVPVPAVDVTIDVNEVLFTHNETYHGVNYVAFWDDAQGSDGSRDALRRAGVQIIRFPGGEPGNWYDWQLALEGMSWSPTDIDDLWAYAEAVGAKLMLQTNPEDNKVDDAGNTADPSAEHAAAWVTYCKTKGIDAPFWEIGNEPESKNNWAQADWDSTKLRWYYDTFNEQAPAMKAADETVTVMGPVAANTWFWWALHDLEMFLHFCDDHTDAIALHWYPHGGANPGWENIRGQAQEWQRHMDYIRSVTAKPVYITEWSSHGYDAGELQFVNALALSSADIIGAFARSGVAGHAWFGSIHNVNGAQWGFLHGANESRPTDTPAPSYYILPLWCAMGNRVLNVTSDADPAVSLSTYAHARDDGSAQVMLINKKGAQDVTLSFDGLDPEGKTMYVHELRPKDGGVWERDVYYNGTLNPNASTEDLPAPAEETVDGTAISRALPAYSITMLDIQPGSSAVRGGRPDEVYRSNRAPPGVDAVAGCPGLIRIAGYPGSTVSILDSRGRRIARLKLPSGSPAARVWQARRPGMYFVVREDPRTPAVRPVAVR